MAGNRLFTLFDDKLRSPDKLVAGPAQSLESLGAGVIDGDSIVNKIRDLDVVRTKADYSDFSNFVFFNSALDYFNITGEKILNEYPFDGSAFENSLFMNSLDGYQRYVMSRWPSFTGHLRFDPVSAFSYIAFDDVGKDSSGVSRTSIVSPGSSSIALEFWCETPPVLTGSNDVMFLFQKVSGTDGVSVYFSGSSLYTRFQSASFVDELAVPAGANRVTYYCVSYDRSGAAPIMSSFTGSVSEFPKLTTYITGSIAGSINAGTSRFYFGTGSLSSKRTIPMSASIDDVRLWSKSLTVGQLSQSFNTKLFAQDNLIGMWGLNEYGRSDTSTVFDRSGSKLNGRVVNYFSGFRASGSLLPFDFSDPVIDINDQNVGSFIAIMQTSGTMYDRDNDNVITRLFPEQFFLLEEFKGTTVLQDFLYIVARYFDQLKVDIDQFVNVLKTNYTSFDQAPDALLEDVARFFGWEFTGNFMSADALKYVLGMGVLKNTAANQQIDVKLFQIKNEFWKRALINLMHIYKTKGTRESVETLLRVYGVDKHLVKLKEYGTKQEAGITTYRISSEKSTNVLAFGSGGLGLDAVVSSSMLTSSFGTIEARFKFPTQTSRNLTSSFQAGSLFGILSSSATTIFSASYRKNDVSSTTGSIVFYTKDGTISLDDVGIFDNTWWNIAFRRDFLSGTVSIDARQQLNGEISKQYSVSASVSPMTTSMQSASVVFGAFNSGPSQMWAQEFRVWNDKIDDSELNDHVLNFQSFGRTNPTFPIIHWRMDDNVSVDAVGDSAGTIHDWSRHGLTGSLYNFAPSSTPFTRYLFDYWHIAPPEYGWNEQKIRSIDSSTVTPGDSFVDSTAVALEFNLVDSLNEDISQMLSTLQNLNEFIGAPANKFRDSYPDLDAIRRKYFEGMSGQLNFRMFADMLEFFDRSFVDMVKRLIPVRAMFLGDEFIVESHMLERPKLQWNYRRKDAEFIPTGVIRVFIR